MTHLSIQAQTSQKKNKVVTLTKVKNSAVSLVAAQQEKTADVESPNITADSSLSAEMSQTSDVALLHPLLKAKNPRGTILLLNNCQTENKHTALIQHLYKELVDRGWSTQLLQTTSNNDLISAISTNAQHIKKQTNRPIALLAHGCDGQSMITYATQKKPSNISAYIALSLAPKVISDEQRTRFNAPLLDIRGGKDRPKSTMDNISWIEAIEASGGKSMELATADRYFSKQENSLILFISNWLR